MICSLKKRLIKEIGVLKNNLEEKKLYHSVFESVTEVLAERSDIEKASELIKESIGLHTCYINYDIDAESDRASIAGLSTEFGPWFADLIRKHNGIPFNFIKDGEDIPLNAASFLCKLREPLVIPPRSYLQLFTAADSDHVDIGAKRLFEFLYADMGDLLVIPLLKACGVMILIKKGGKQFSPSEIGFLSTLSKSIRITLDRMYCTFHDELGIKNVVFFRQKIEQVVNDGIDFAVVFIKLNALKQINEDHSYIVGDRLLAGIVKRLRMRFERMEYKNPDSLIARKSGVLFMLCLPGVSDKAGLAKQMRLIDAYLSKPFRFDGVRISLEKTVHLGGCLSKDARSASELLAFANDALQHARRSSRARRVVYDPRIARKKRWRKNIIRIIQSIESRGKDSLNRFRLVYQEKIDARSNGIIGYEALLRLQTRSSRLIPPVCIIKIAEEENLIGNIDFWVIREACRQIKAWADAGCMIPISVNISRYHLGDAILGERISRIFRELDFNDYRHLLKMEITETGLLSQKSIDGLVRLHEEFGIKVSLDDVGKNQANLHAILTLYVNNLLESVKIDREYVQKILRYDNSRNLVKSESGTPVLDDHGCKYILSMLNMFNAIFNTPGIKRPSIICEGVEHKKQEEWLIQNNCYLLQGFLYGRPELPEKCEEKLRQRTRFADSGDA